MMAAAAEELPHLFATTEVVAHDGGDGSLSWCANQQEFEFGLHVLLEGLERRLAALSVVNGVVLSGWITQARSTPEPKVIPA